MGDEAAACTTHEFQYVGRNVCERFGLRPCQGNVDKGSHHSDQCPMQNEMGFDPPTHPERSQKARDEGSGRSSVMQEIVAETQANRNNRENESHFRKQPADQNSPPVDSCVAHFSIPVPLVELLAIITIGDERKSVVTSLTFLGNYFRVTGPPEVMGHHGLGRCVPKSSCGPRSPFPD